MLLFVNSTVCELLMFVLVSGIEKGDLFDHSTMLGYDQRNSLIQQNKYRREPLVANMIHLLYTDGSQKITKKNE